MTNVTSVPDGGLIAWLQVAGSFALFFNCWGLVNSYGTFQTYYEDALLRDMSSDAISWVGSTQSFLLSLVGVVVGPLYDMGYLRELTIAGTLSVSAGFILLSFCEEYYQVFLCQAVLIGVGAGLIYIPALAQLPRYFSTRRALAMGIVSSGSSLGGIIYPLIFQGIQPEAGFGWASRAMGFIALGTCSVAVVVYRARGEYTERRSLLDLAAFRETRYQIYCAACIFAYIGFFGPIFYMQPYALSHGMEDGTLALYLVAICNAASMVGRIFTAYVGDKLGPLNTVVFACAACSVVTLSWPAVHTPAGSVVFAIAYGATSGGIITMSSVVLAVLTEDMTRLGARMGMASVISGLGSLCGPPIAGAIYEGTGDYLGLQLFCGFMIVASGILFGVLRLNVKSSGRVELEDVDAGAAPVAVVAAAPK